MPSFRRIAMQYDILVPVVYETIFVFYAGRQHHQEFAVRDDEPIWLDIVIHQFFLF